MADNEDTEELTIADDVVVTKYQTSAQIANDIMSEIAKMCMAGASVRDICTFGDKRITERTVEVHKKDKEMTKGIGFPVCVSVNHVVCHFSPSVAESDSKDPDVLLKNDDVVKIDLGVHIDGFIAGLGHTLVVGADESKENKVSGRRADVILAAYYATEAALRLFMDGTERSNTAVQKKVTEIAKIFNCNPVEGMLSHQLQQNIIDGDKTIIQAPSDLQNRDHKKCEFETHEVYCLDVIMSTGDGKAKEAVDKKTTVYKRTENTYSLKLKASKQFFSEVCKKFTTMPFTLRTFEDQKKARLAVNECTNHELLDPYPVLLEKDGELVAQFKTTVLLMPKGPLRITHGPFNKDKYESEYKLDEANQALVSKPLQVKNKSKGKKKAAVQAQKDISNETNTPVLPPVVEGTTA